jgi:hypothetical protein
MILRVVLRSLATRPMRTGVLATGFGLAIAVMAELLGVGEVILEQAHSPALRGGGDLVVAGAFGSVENARFVLSNVIGSEPLRSRVAAASPSRRAGLYLITPNATVPVSVRAGIPELEKAVGDPEVAGIAEWTDAPGDAVWSTPNQADLLRAMDRFHPVPQPSNPPGGESGFPPSTGSGEARRRAFNRASWAEWLYFNGRSRDGQLRFYLAFLTGPPDAGGKRQALVRLQLDRRGRTSNYSTTDTVDDKAVLERAPDLDIGTNRVRLEGLQYRLMLALTREGSGAASRRKDSDLRGEITLDAMPGRSLPPSAIRGAHGWVSGYVAPVLSGMVRGALSVEGEHVSLDGLAGYHDHNWGFWEGVSWQWGQAQQGDLSVIYGRVFPPREAADPETIPGFVGALGPDGPLGYSTDVRITETNDDRGQPRSIALQARGTSLDLDLTFTVTSSVTTHMAGGPLGSGMDFLQMRGDYEVRGRAGERQIRFTAPGAAETFRGRPKER